MTTWLPRWFVLLVLPLLFVPLFAAEPDDKEIARLIKQLCDDDFDQREAETVRLWDATTGKELRKYEGHTEEAFSVCFGPEGQALSGGFDFKMIQWDLNTGKEVGVFAGTYAVFSTAYSDKAKLAATGSLEGS